MKKCEKCFWKDIKPICEARKENGKKTCLDKLMKKGGKVNGKSYK